MKDKFTDIMLDIIPTWKTIDEILIELKQKYDIEISNRALRKMFENYNYEYQAHLTKGYNITHGCRGYKITQDHSEMIKSDGDLFKRSMKMLNRVYKNKKARQEDYNIQDMAQEISTQLKKFDAENTKQSIK